jgi:pimeloyl-ACP methyl ester carboxylesterase
MKMEKEAIQHSQEKLTKANGIEINYDTFGAPSDPPVLLIAGLGMQMISWDERFCQMLAAQGYWVIRFDNRDVGLSTHMDQAGVPDIAKLFSGEAVEVPYKLIDLAEDAVGLLDALDIEQAHVVGISLGGMVAQTIAIHYPERVQTLTSLMSTTGDPQLPQPKPEALSILFTPAPFEREPYLDYQLQVWHTLSGPKFGLDEARVRHQAERAFDRGLNPAGFARQLAAVMASGSRKDALKELQAPTLVVHGDADPLIPVEGGYDTAKSIPGARLEIVEGVGHELPPEIWSWLVTLISNHASQESKHGSS